MTQRHINNMYTFKTFNVDLKKLLLLYHCFNENKFFIF